jgi:hypothetical protein
VGTILHGQNLNVAVLLDSDPEGKSAYEQLVHQWIMDAKQVLRLADILGTKHQCVLEDLFAEDYYLKHVNAAYENEIGKASLELGGDQNCPIVDRVEQALKERGVEKFNKGRVAKRIMLDLAKLKLADLPAETVGSFQKVIAAANAVVAGWKKP